MSEPVGRSIPRGGEASSPEEGAATAGEVDDGLQATCVGIISLREGLDWTTPSGRLQAQLLAPIAELVRARKGARMRSGGVVIALVVGMAGCSGRDAVRDDAVALTGDSVNSSGCSSPHLLGHTVATARRGELIDAFDRRVSLSTGVRL